MTIHRKPVTSVRWQEATPAPSPLPSERKPTEEAESSDKGTLQGPSNRPGRPPLRFVQATYWRATNKWGATCPLCKIAKAVIPGDKTYCCGSFFVPVEVIWQ